MKKIILKIDGMSCSACSSGLEKYLSKQEGIVSVSVNLVLAQAMIMYEDNLTVDDLFHMISEAGFQSLGEYDEAINIRSKQKRDLIVYFILIIFLMYISMSDMFHLPQVALLKKADYPIFYTLSLLIGTIPFLFYGRDIFKNGYKNLRHKTPNMDSLISIGVLSSLIYSVYGFIMICNEHSAYVHTLYFESIAMVIFFVKLGRYIDSKSKEKTKKAIEGLVQITPEYALLKTEDGEEQVTLDKVKKGDILLCKPGMKVAADGILLQGESYIDESLITGESMPVLKKERDTVIAGSINQNGYFEYQAVRIGRESTISEIVRLVAEASTIKPPMAKLADTVSGYFVPVILLIAIITFIVYMILGYDIFVALSHFVTILVVACPCSLGLATPLAIVISEGVCARKGILVKSSEIFEQAHKVDTIVFDKTGTLTYGQVCVSKLYNFSTYSEEELLQIVASIESKSSHPLARAFSNIDGISKLPLIQISSFKNLPGLGIEGMLERTHIYIGNDKLVQKVGIKNTHYKEADELSLQGSSIVYVMEEKEIIALIGIQDTLRKSAPNVIKDLSHLGKTVCMLTGDNSKTAKTVAEKLGIEKVIANVLPKDKTNYIQQMMQRENMVMMVGDGINDAPSLVTASIGVSVMGSTDIASDAADVILLHDNLHLIVDLIHMSQRTVRNIQQNLFWAFFYNLCMIPIAMGILEPFGIQMNPMIASLAMTMSSLTVVVNALRLYK